MQSRAPPIRKWRRKRPWFAGGMARLVLTNALATVMAVHLAVPLPSRQGSARTADGQRISAMRSEPHRASSPSIGITRVAQPVRFQTPPAPSRPLPCPFTSGHPSETLSNFFRYISIVGWFAGMVRFAGPPPPPDNGTAAERTLLWVSTDTAQRGANGRELATRRSPIGRPHPTISPASAFDPARETKTNMLASDTDLPPAAVTEIASILARGYVRYRASLRRAPLGHADGNHGNQAQPTAANPGLAFPATPSVHVTVVNAQSSGEKGEKR
jgi:hypothetical protein